MSLTAMARIALKPVHFDEAQAAILAIVPRTLAEAGCVQFVVHADASASCIYLYEEWADDAALRFHHAQPYTAAVFRAYAEWLAEPVRLETMTRIG